MLAKKGAYRERGGRDRPKNPELKQGAKAVPLAVKWKQLYATLLVTERGIALVFRE